MLPAAGPEAGAMPAAAMPTMAEGSSAKGCTKIAGTTVETQRALTAPQDKMEEAMEAVGRIEGAVEPIPVTEEALLSMGATVVVLKVTTPALPATVAPSLRKPALRGATT